MNTERAAEILQSAKVIDVTYQNNSVWIEDVNKDRNTAMVKNLNTDDIREVPVTELQER